MICFINYSIGPYHRARFAKLQEKFGDEIVFIELTSKSSKYQWRNESSSINATTLFQDKLFSEVESNKMVAATLNTLEQIKPDVVLTVSYASAAMRAAAQWARKNNAVSICVNDSWKGDKPRFFLWELAKGLWCRLHYDGMFLSGQRSQEYYHGIGFPNSRIWLGQNCVDNDYFTDQGLKFKANADEYRKKYALPSHYFLCVARLSPEKNLERLFRSFHQYKQRGGSWDLVLVGAGPQEQQMKIFASALGIKDHLFFYGWKQIEEMPVFFSLASCLILPSISETWGLVVNEAMASGLPVLISDKCGCMPDLCFKGVNGFNFDPYNEEEITEAMIKISSGEYDLRRMGQVSLNLAQKYSVENYAASLSDCILTLQK